MTWWTSLDMDSSLPLKNRIAMWMHYGLCPGCRRYRHHLLMIRRAARCQHDIMDQRGLSTSSSPAFDPTAIQAHIKYLADTEPG
ncbi:MAG: hypothetical protein LR011_12815 [Verrucomicrobia bacterium]|nr:hypothetical protein [Verrucomicrobiota bacterium]